MKIEFHQECTDSYSGQQNMTLTAFKDGAKAGHVDWVRFDNVPSISMIHTESAFRRQGVATAMLQHLQNEFLQTPIQWGDVATPEGAALIKKITFSIPNPERQEALAELRTVRYHIDFMSTSEAGDGASRLSAQEWNEAHDKHKELSEFVASTVPELRFVRGAGCPAEQIFRASEALRVVEDGASTSHPKP